MPQSLANILLHLVFGTKNRVACIEPLIERELYPYLASICGALACAPHKIGGTANHVHITCSLSRTTTVSKLLEEVKKNSSKWLKTKGANYRRFAWQNGYGAFSIGQSQLENLECYIEQQKEHHKRKTFEQELRELLTKYRVPYDERYIWD